MSFDAELQQCRDRIEQQLPLALHALKLSDQRLADAMHYGLMNGGKRLRPFLVYATAKLFGAVAEQADAAAVAIEMVHSYSLVHDDLPAMDDDQLRRGKPTCHIAFDEATAILAGDGLLTAAFDVLATAETLSVTQRLKLIQLLAQGAGGAGMVAGQSIDLNHVGQSMTLAELENMHRHKTGALIKAAVLMGAVCAQPELNASQQQALSDYADHLGLAFQIWDDVLDVEGDSAALGKSQGKDQEHNKPTYPALMGMAAAKDKAWWHVTQARAVLQKIGGQNELLQQLADYVVQRKY